MLAFADLDAWKAYQGEVIAGTARVLASMPKLPPNMQNIYYTIVTGPDAPLHKLEVLECFIYQHGLRHMGEVEHGRALVGLAGMTS